MRSTTCCHDPLLPTTFCGIWFQPRTRRMAKRVRCCLSYRCLMRLLDFTAPSSWRLRSTAARSMTMSLPSDWMKPNCAPSPLIHLSSATFSYSPRCCRSPPHKAFGAAGLQVQRCPSQIHPLQHDRQGRLISGGEGKLCRPTPTTPIGVDLNCEARSCAFRDERAIDLGERSSCLNDGLWVVAAANAPGNEPQSP